VANATDGTVTPLDLSNPLVPVAQEAVTVRTSPYGVAVSANGLFALVPNFATNDVVPLDLSNPLAPVAQPAVTVGLSPYGISIASNGLFALVANYGYGTITPLDLSDPLAPVAQSPVTVGAGPVNVVISPNGLFALVANATASTITPLDLTNPLIPVAHTAVAVGTAPYGISIAASGLFALIANFTSSNVTPLDLTTPLVPVAHAAVTVGTSPFGIAIAPNGKFAIATSYGTASVTPLDLTTPLAPVAQSPVSVGTQPFGISISSDSRYALVANSGSNNVTPLDLANPLVPVAHTAIAVGTGPFSLGPTMIYSRPPYNPRGAGPADLNWFPVNGQSLAVGQIGVPALSTSPSSLHKMFVDGVRYQYDYTATAESVALASFAGLKEQTCPDGRWSATLGETPCSGAAQMITQLITAENGAGAAAAYRMLESSPGYGAQTIAQLSMGSTHFSRLLAQTLAGWKLAGEQGWSFAAQAMAWIQGESDYISATTRADYTASLLQLATDWNSQGRRFALQSFTPLILVAQIASHLYTPTPTPTIALAQTDAAAATAGIKMACAMYQFDYPVADWHIDAPSQKWLGAYLGLAYKRLVYDQSSTWAALQVTSASHVGAVVTLATNAASQLVFDTTWVTAQTNQGFDVVDSGGNPLTINSVALQGTNQVVITLSATMPAGATWRYGWRGTTGQTGPGRVTGARGNVRDSQGASITFDPGDGGGARPMHDWLLIGAGSIS